MVFFTCNACGESLKKAQVDKHAGMCRGCQVLSCIDCGKDFWGDDYKNHTRCISEDQKYGGKGYEAKSNKGDVKQQQWLQRVHEALSRPGISSGLRNVLDQVSAYDNVPRKKAKFQNWMKNSLKISNQGLHDQVWDIISAATDNASAEMKKAEEPKQMPSTDTIVEIHNGSKGEEKKKKLNKRERKEARQQKNGKKRVQAVEIQEEEGEEAVVEKKKTKKRKQEEGAEHNGHIENGAVSGRKKKRRTETPESCEENQTSFDVIEEAHQTQDQTDPKGKFNWKGTIKAVLRQAPEQELSVKKLRKKVLAAYLSFSGDTNFKTEEELLALFNKKISGNPKFRLLKERVRLVK